MTTRAPVIECRTNQTGIRARRVAAQAKVDFIVVRWEFSRGTAVIAANLTIEELVPLVDPGIADVATVSEEPRAVYTRGRTGAGPSVAIPRGRLRMLV